MRLNLPRAGVSCGVLRRGRAARRGGPGASERGRRFVEQMTDTCTHPVSMAVSGDGRAKLRSSIRRVLAKHEYPPGKQPGAISLPVDQMKSMAPQAAGAASSLSGPRGG